jgi:Flp pilus assembly protein protease CpaA
MPSFLKSPKVIVGTIVVLWIAYVIYNNLEKSVDFRLLPFNILTIQLRVSAVVVGSALFGAVVTIVIQFLWKRRSKNAVSPAPVASSSTAQ